MLNDLVEAFLGGLGIAAIAQLEVERYLAHDASAGVAPCQTAAEFQLLVCVSVRSVGLDVVGNVEEATLQVLGRGKMRSLLGKLTDEGNGFIDLGLDGLGVGIPDGGEASLVHHGPVAFMRGTSDGVTRLFDIGGLGGLDGDLITRLELLEVDLLVMKKRAPTADGRCMDGITFLGLTGARSLLGIIR